MPPRSSKRKATTEATEATVSDAAAAAAPAIKEASDDEDEDENEMTDEQKAPAAAATKAAAAAPAAAVEAAAAAESEAEEESEEQRPKKQQKKAAADDAASASTAAAAAAPAPASAALLSFPAPMLKGPSAAYAAAFDSIARSLLLDLDLMANGHRLKLREVEMYWKAEPSHSSAGNNPDSHEDVFAHGHPVQKDSFGKWYWHRQGQKPDASYKAGNYKGLDVTFGAVGGGGHGGILIRSIEKADGTVVEGSCLVADEILRLHKVESINALVAQWKGNTSAFDNPTLFFTAAKGRRALKAGAPAIIKSPRVGLTLKQAGETRPRYIMQPYRYCALPFFNKKMKQTCVLSVYAELGSSQLSKVRDICDCTAAYLDKLVATFESGKKLKSMDKFVKDNKAALNTDAMAQMYGAWMSAYGGKHTAILRA